MTLPTATIRRLYDVYTRDSHDHTTAAVSWSSPSSPISSASCARRRVTRWPPSSARCARSSASRLRRPRDDKAWACLGSYCVPAFCASGAVRSSRGALLLVMAILIHIREGVVERQRGGRDGFKGPVHVLASSLLVIICFVKNDLPDPREYLVQPLSTKELAKRSSFFSPGAFAGQGPATFKQFSAARREAGKLPRSPRFKWRAGTPHPPVYQASGTDGLLSGRSKCARLCELHERASRPPR